MAFANPFAVSIASDVLGLELASFDEVHAIYTEFANGVVNYRDPNARKATIRAREQLTGLVMPIIEQRRCHPDDSLLSSVLRSEHLLSTDEELLANLRVILFGAIETVESMILNTAWALLHHREQLMAALADASLWPAVVQEGLRWIPPVGYSDRWTTQTVQLGGVTIPSGEYVVPVFAAANRDPGTFPDPDRFDISRGDDRRNLSFGKGIHMCLGVNLARLQGSLALKSLFERLPNLELNPERPSEPVGFNFRRPPHLYVRWRHL
ncbi:MAG: cytochrome P450 [Solirubrobacterales bacterium]|nr:cytochrome P450 [Solirubrobacterales bacterium]